ncbi:MAG: gliding motility-associated C-terminal domain-containing protein [Crocinitomicaceae bacterium]
MIKTFKSLILTTVLLISSTQLFATHVAGGNIAYRCTGIPNQFIITLTAYRDCDAFANLGNTASISISNDCGFNTPTNLIVNRIEITEVSQICTAELPNTSCDGTGALEGMEKQVFTGIITLPDTCDSWTFSWSACNRNAVTNLANSDGECFYIETTLNSGTQACNNSPTINAQPIPYVCSGQQVTYDYGILEPDGDSLTFEFVDPLDNATTTIAFNPPYTTAQPIPGIAIDLNTGQITFNTTLTGNFVVAVLIKEYNQCDELVGTMIHDIQFVIEVCTNQVPQVVTTPSVITNFNNFGTNAQLVGDNQIKLCTGDQFCFNISFDDVDPNTQVLLSSNVDAFLPGATFNTVPGNPATATICWTYTQGYTGSVISVNATDDACPVPGFANYVIDLDVPPAVFPGEDSTFFLCGDEGVINLFDYLGGFFQINGEWQAPNGDSISNFQSVDNMTSGVYTYIVFPDSAAAADCGVAPNPCVEADSSELTITIGNLDVFFDDANVINESCTDMFDGQASIGPVTGNLGPFSVVWTSPYSGVHFDTIVNAGGSSSVFDLYQDETGANPWLVTVTDQNGCSWSKTFQILEGAMNIVPTIGQPTCFGQATGSLIVNNVVAGQAVATDFFITNIDGDTLNESPTNPGSYFNLINNVNAGTYIVYATDDFGCESANQFQITEPHPGPISVALNLFHPDCHQTPEGVITVLDAFNTDSDIDDIFFAWSPIPPGNSTATITGKTTLVNCLPGTYTLVINDEAGCTNDTVITILDRVPLAANVNVFSNTYCRTASFQSGNGVVVAETAVDSAGTGSVDYRWKHLVSGAESKNSTFVVREPGNLELTIFDAFGCSYVDTIYVDSINPVADFLLTSPGFFVDGIYEGEEELKIKLENLSTGFSQENNPNSDTIFEINFNHQNVGGQGNWFFSFDYDEKPDTAYNAVNINETTTYEVCLVAKNFNDCRDTICKDVIVHKKPELIIPNVFTPGSEPNINFYFPGAGYPEFQATVFNRYGVPVFEFTSITDQWDGTHYKTGKPCVDGVYSITYKGSTSNGSVTEGNGQVHLIRHKP